MTQFASDNTAGTCPEAWQALAEANEGFVLSYGDDSHTLRAADAIRQFFDADAEVYFCFNGTAANSMSLAHICRSYHSIIAHPASHIENDECGGPEFFSHGAKLLLAPGDHGKMTPESLTEVVKKRSDIHFPKPRVVSITQSTEVGTCYSLEEVKALCEQARADELVVHMDGARLMNALAALDVEPADLTWRAGVDVLCFGATKNGLPVGDAVIFFNRELSKDFDYRCKQAGQLASKMRFLTAPYAPLLEQGTFLKNARHANACAARLAAELSRIEGFELVRPQEVNSAFFEVSEPKLAHLRAHGVHVHDFFGGGVRFMCSWDTQQSDLERLFELARSAPEE